MEALDDDTVDWLQQHSASDETIDPNEEELVSIYKIILHL